jgi:hypothetical protein
MSRVAQAKQSRAVWFIWAGGVGRRVEKSKARPRLQHKQARRRWSHADSERISSFVYGGQHRPWPCRPGRACERSKRG